MSCFLRPLLMFAVPGVLALSGWVYASEAPEEQQEPTSEASSELDPRILFREGVAAFNDGRLEEARVLLERALREGLDTNALRYNLGVVNYRLQRYGDAREHFSRLLDTDHRPLALFNLGLVAESAGREDEAAGFFRQVLGEAEDDGLKRMAASKLVPDAPPAAEREPLVEGLVSVSYGYEDNLAQLPDSAPTSLSDNFSDLLLAARMRPWQSQSGHSENAAEVTLAAFRRHYHSESDFHSDFGQVGLAWINARENHRRSIGVKQAYLRFSGRSREWQSSLDLNYRLQNCLGAGANQCELGLQATQVTAFSDFESRQGQRYRADASYRQRRGDWETRLGYRYEFNDRRDFEQDFLVIEDDELKVRTAFASRSPMRHRTRAALRYHGDAGFVLGGELNYRYSDFPDPYEGPVVSGRRIDHRYGVTLSADLPIGDVMLLGLEGSYRRNESSLEPFDHDNYIIQLSLRHAF